MSDVREASAAEEHELQRALGPFSLIALGIGSIIGAGIFVITGTAAALHAGPAVMLSFVVSGFGSLFAGLCYAEFAAMIPVAGSAYSYSYATMGRWVAWFIGWNLVLEYLVAASTVAVGWSGYFTSLMGNLGITLPVAFSNAPLTFSSAHQVVLTGAILNLPAIALIVFLTTFLVVGVRESARFNGLMVLTKVTVVIIVIFFGFSFIRPENLTPFIPPNPAAAGKAGLDAFTAEFHNFGQYGWSGILTGAGMVFFAYIGFDAVSVAAQEAKNPQRDMPIGILGSLFICTALYILMALVLTGIAPYKTLNVANPVSLAVSNVAALAWLAPIVNIGATVGLASVVFVSLYGQSRIFYSMSRDGFLPRLFSQVHARFKTPHRGTILTGAFAMVLAGLLPLDILGELVSIGTLTAFTVVCIGVMILRVRSPKAKRPFRTPFVWLVAPAGIIVCGAMMYGLPTDTWYRLAGWTVFGFLIFFLYGVWHTKARPKWTIEEAD